MKYSRLRGTQDIIPPEIERWRVVEGAFQETLDRFAYSGIRTPIIEPTDLFVRAVGEQSDIVAKEMYTFEDRGGRSVTLRPENTASVIRAYLENGMHRLGGIQRLSYFGPMFRYDRPQAGRYRQFHQVGAEAIGSDNPAIDVEMIEVVVDAMKRIGFEKVDIRINSVGGSESRNAYRGVLLEAIRDHADKFGSDALERYEKNPLRIFDSKDYGDALKKSLPVISDYLVGADTEHFARVTDLLGDVGIVHTIDPHLVRGLDYYTRTVFEVYFEAHGAQSALCGGGRYDNLVEQCGGPPTPAIGFSAGLERIIAALPTGGEGGGWAHTGIVYYVVCADAESAGRALRAAAVLRRLGNTELDLSDRSRKKQLQVAEKKHARFAIVAGSDAPDRLTVRDIGERRDEEVADDTLAAFLEGRAHGGKEPV